MPDPPPPPASEPSSQTWENAPDAPRPGEVPRRTADGEQTTIERAKGLVMLHSGVNSHVAFAMLARWSRRADQDVATFAKELVDRTVRDEPRYGWLPLADLMDGHVIDTG